MPFREAIRTCLGKYRTFSGRARQPEFWWFFLFGALCNAAAQAVDAVLGVWIVALVIWLVLLLPFIAVGVRRLHDVDQTGWWMLLGLIPLLGELALLFMFTKDSTPGDNRFGLATQR